MKSVGIFLASSTPTFDVGDDLKIFANSISDLDLDVVYGGGKFGLMGQLNEHVKASGTKISGVTLTMFDKIGATPNNLDNFEIESDFFSRKKALMDNSDFFVVFPGGIGTADELFDVLNHSTLGIIEKNIYLFNKDGCWDGLIQWINKSVELKMLKDFPNTLFVDSSIKNIIEKIKDNEF